jgi:peptidoglycan/LPS O-acetylase OafA/YrhL
MTSVAARPSPETIEGPPRTRLESLTGLRWFAAFGVFFSHVAILLPLPYLNELFVLGTAGVTFFFVLSGYVLTWTFFDRDTAPKFYWRRFARIWPSLFITTVAAVALLVGGQLWPTEGGTSLVWWTVATLLMVQAWFPSSFQGDTVPHTVAWSLSCEAFFYGLFPGLVRWLLGASADRLAVPVCAATAALWRVRIGLWFAYPPVRHVSSLDGYGPAVFCVYSPLVRLPQFLIGMAVAIRVRPENQQHRRDDDCVLDGEAHGGSVAGGRCRCVLRSRRCWSRWRCCGCCAGTRCSTPATRRPPRSWHC